MMTFMLGILHRNVRNVAFFFYSCAPGKLKADIVFFEFLFLILCAMFPFLLVRSATKVALRSGAFTQF